MRASLQQAQANRDLGQVTWNRDSVLVQKGWVTAEQGDTDRLNLEAQKAASSGKPPPHCWSGQVAFASDSAMAASKDLESTLR